VAIVIIVSRAVASLIPGFIRTVVVIFLESAPLVMIPVMHLVISAVLHTLLVVPVLRIIFVAVRVMVIHIIMVFLRNRRRDCPRTASGHSESESYRPNPHKLLQVLLQGHCPLLLSCESTLSFNSAGWSKSQES
jgi:hypothetical protein